MQKSLIWGASRNRIKNAGHVFVEIKMWCDRKLYIHCDSTLMVIT